MYRLHNLGIEPKIDWLVTHGKLYNKKVIVSPWDDDGMKIYDYYTKRWGGNFLYIVDDEVSKYNKKIYRREEIEYDENCVFLLSIQNSQGVHLDYVNWLYENGFFDQTYILRGDGLRAQDALIKCCDDHTIKSVLDVGCGVGHHSRIFLEYGKEVTGIEMGGHCRVLNPKFNLINEDFLSTNLDEKYDLVWCSHVLEHQFNIGMFIKKLFACCKDEGKVAITVPDGQEGMIVAGHVSLWNVGVLLYNIIKAGYDCKHAKAKTYAGNVSVIVPKEPIVSNENPYVWDDRKYFPEHHNYGRSRFGGIFFNGNIAELNWDDR